MWLCTYCDVVTDRSTRPVWTACSAQRPGEVGLVLSTTRSCSGGCAEVCGCAPIATSSLTEAHDQLGQHAAARWPGEEGLVLSTTRNCSGGFAEVCDLAGTELTRVERHLPSYGGEEQQRRPPCGLSAVRAVPQRSLPSLLGPERPSFVPDLLVVSSPARALPRPSRQHRRAERLGTKEGSGERNRGKV